MTAWLCAFVELVCLAFVFWLLSLITGRPVTMSLLTFGVAFTALVRTHRLRLAA